MPDRPLPTADSDSRPFWDAARRHRLALQRCSACERYVFYPRFLCPHCFGELTWTEVSGQGEIYSFTVVHRAPPAFADDVPYAVALVELIEGPRMLSRVVECPLEQIGIGMPVEVTFEDVSEEISLPHFRPREAGTGGR